MSYISDEVRVQVAALEAREKTLVTRAKRLIPVWMGLAGATCAASLGALFLGPDKQPSSIDVPSKVLELFSANVPSSGGMPFESAAGTLIIAMASLGPKMLFVAFLGILIGGGYAVIKDNMGAAVKIVITSCMVLGPPFAFNFFLGMNGDMVGKQISPRASFMEAVEKHRYNAVLEDLKAVKLDATTAGEYVLAQIAVADGIEAAKHVRKGELERAVALHPVGPTFTPTGQALYAIEHAAFGAPKSPAAVAYQDERLARQGWAKTTAVVLGTLSAAVGCLALGFLALRRLLAQRVHRIHALLAHGSTTANNN